jgi:hypothetical protein
MRSSALHVLYVVVLALAAVVATDCSHETLGSGSQDLNMTYTPSPAGAGRFERATFNVATIQLLPADPAEAAIYGTERLQFRFSPFAANLTLTEAVPFSQIALSTGTYRVTRIEFTRLVLVDEDLAPNPATCMDGLAVVDGTKPPGQVPLRYLFDDPPDNLSRLTFTIQPGQTTLALTVDVPGLIAGYESSFTCLLVPCPGCPVNPKPTLTAFNATTFKAALLANITIK